MLDFYIVFILTKGANFSKFPEIFTPSNGGCSPTAFRIFVDHFVIFSSNHGICFEEKNWRGSINEFYFPALAAFSWENIFNLF